MTKTPHGMTKDDVSPEYGSMSDDEQDVVGGHHSTLRSSWMRSVNVTTPLKKLMESNNRRHSISTDDYYQQHPLQAKCKLIRDMCSPEKLLQKRHQDEQDKTEAQSLTPTDNSKEDIEKVYEKFEILLDVLRMERHQEKLETDQEIEALRAKISVMELRQQQEANNHILSLKTTTNAKHDKSALSEMWNSIDGVADNHRLLLRLNEQPEPEATNDKKDCAPKPSARDYEQKLRDSVKQLMARDAQFVAEKDRKLLAWYFEDANNNNNDDNKGPGCNNNKSHEVERLELQQRIIAEQEQNLQEMSVKYLTAMKEVQEQNDRILDEVEKNREATNKLEQVQEELNQTRDELEKVQANQDEREDKENSSCKIKEVLSVEQNLAKTEGLTLEEKVNRQMKELNVKLHKLQGELSGTKRNHSDVLMKLAVESTCRASLSMKLDTALAQIEKQKQTISQLNQELGKAKYEADLYSQKAQEVLKESKMLLLEGTRVSLNDFSF